MTFRAWVLALAAAFIVSPALADQHHLHRFKRQRLTGEYYSEGVAFGDINGDGVQDVVHGPLWFAGPHYEQSHEIYPPRPQDRNRYADSFFSWVHDFNGDGRADILTAGFPGTPAYVYENTGQHDQHWPKHEVFDWVSNESPQFIQLVGDERPELVCTRDGYFGFAEYDPAAPFEPWKFQRISEQIAPKRFGHGLGVGDVDGDGRSDVLFSGGWFRQPENPHGPWRLHPFRFTQRGGAEMHVYDVDGDGDGDVISSLAAHEFGLAWFEQKKVDGRITFQQHTIMGETPEENPFGLVFSELHSVAMADINGDGLKDIVTGKTYWSHHRQSPMWDAGAVVYWFELKRTSNGPQWIPHLADDTSGIGRQVTVGDLNADGHPDLLAGGMKGCHVLLHEVEKVDHATWLAWQPKPRVELADGLQPQEAADRMTAPPGFRVELAAGEPLVHQPIAMAYDERGRLWVAEAHTYPRRAPEGEGKDRIIILEDSDGDGSLDHRKVFIEGLNLVSGMEVGFGGVWVGAAPYFMFIPDRDHDDVPDAKPQILLDGFGYQDTHETLNAFIWGPDGWLYGCHGVFTHSKVGKPGASDDQRTSMNAAVWRYHPLRHEFEVFARGTSNPWGVDFNDRGQAFITACVIPHLWHVIQGARYQRQGGRHFNPYLYDDIKTIADHSHYVGNIRDHAWWGHEPSVPSSTSAAGGGHAHCGAMIYLGDNWPERYRNQIFMSNIHGNRVNTDLLRRRGSGYVGSHGPDFLMANDRWYRGINLRYGPDGSVLLIDWYDRNACHRTNPEIWDRTNGRVFRITYGDRKPVNVDLNTLTNDELISLHRHPNEWFTRSARKVLMHREVGEDVKPQLIRLLHSRHEAPVRLRALWTMHALGLITVDHTEALLTDADEYIRAWSIQLAAEDLEVEPRLQLEMAKLAKNDPSPVVRLYLASAAERIGGDFAWQMVSRLALREEDAEDHNLPLLIWYATEPLVTTDPSRALTIAREAKIPRIREYILRRTAADNEALGPLVQSAAESDDLAWTRTVLAEMQRSFEGRVDVPMPKTWENAYAKFSRSKDESIRDAADALAVIFGDKRIFPRLRAVLADTKQPLKQRTRALEIIVRGRDEKAAPSLIAALDTAPLRGPALRALAAYDNDAAATAIMKRYSTFDSAQQRDAINTLVARPESADKLLTAIEDGKIPTSHLHAYNVRQILGFNDQQLAARVRKSWGKISESSAEKKARIVQLKRLLTQRRVAAANPNHGRMLFTKTCASCHKLFGDGGDVGPDITGSNRANVDYLLENIVDPSAVLGRDYRMTSVVTADGRVVTGLIKNETDSALTIRTLNDTVIVPLDEIEDRKLSELSMMPERLLETMSNEEILDLVAYLQSPNQVAMKGPRAPIDPETKKTPNAIEGESMKIVGKSGGRAASQPMGNFAKDNWSGQSQLWWTGAKPGDTLALAVPVPQTGRYDVEVVLTRARDYGIVQLSLDGSPLGGPIDLYDPEVVTTGVLTFPDILMKKGEKALTIKVTGANPQAAKSFMVGLDYIRLVPKPSTP